MLRVKVLKNDKKPVQMNSLPTWQTDSAFEKN